MTPGQARALLESSTAGWVDDPGSDIVWAGEYDGRWGIRMAQQARDFTTIWFGIGDRTISVEAYLLPNPQRGHAEVYRLCLARNASSWPVLLCVDRAGDIYVRGRMPLSDLSVDAVDRLVGAVYELVELTFRPLLRLGFQRG